MTDDAYPDRVSRHLLADLDEVKRLEERTRGLSRTSPEFREMATQIERAARHVFDHAQLEDQIARDDALLPGERVDCAARLGGPGRLTNPRPDRCL